MTDEELPIILCGRVSMGPYPYADNIEGLCADCNEPIIWRAHSPAGVHVCLSCGMERVRKEKAQGRPPEYIITQRTQDELREQGIYLVTPDKAKQQ